MRAPPSSPIAQTAKLAGISPAPSAFIAETMGPWLYTNAKLMPADNAPATTTMIRPPRKLPERRCSSFRSARSRPKPAMAAKITPSSMMATPSRTALPAAEFRFGASLNRPEPLTIIGSVTPTDTPRPVRMPPVKAIPMRTKHNPQRIFATPHDKANRFAFTKVEESMWR